MDVGMNAVWESVIETRVRDKTLGNRLSLFSNMILVAKNSDYRGREKIILDLIRKSSETGSFRNTAEIISLEAFNEIVQKFPKNSRGNHVVPKISKKLFRHEHIIPCKHLKNYILKNKLEQNQIKDLLLKNGVRAIITIEEDYNLPKMDMPEKWAFGHNPFKRYSENGIMVLEKPGYIKP